jgi:hypothetical protein
MSMGARAKLTPQQVYIIGVVLSIISAAVIYFTLVKPGNEALQTAKADLQQQTDIAAKQPKADADQVKAKQLVALAQAKWAIYDRRYMPDIDLSNRMKGIQQLWHEQVEVLGPAAERFLRADHTVEVLQDGIAVAAPPSDPNAVVAKQFTFDLGSVSVVGTFNEVLNHASRWNKFNRLVLMDNLTLSGSSPRLVGQYTLRCFEFTHNADKPGEAIPQAAAPTGGAGGRGGGPPTGGNFEVMPPSSAGPGGGSPGGPGPMGSGGPMPMPSGSGGPR